MTYNWPNSAFFKFQEYAKTREFADNIRAFLFFSEELELIENLLHINVVINWQLSKHGYRWPV